MSYECFLDCLEKELLKRKGREERIHRVRILKNNGLKLDGFSFQVRGHREQPTVYVNHYYKEAIQKSELEATAELVIGIMRDSILGPEQGLEHLLDYEKMKGQIYYRLISREQNPELLEEIPHIPWLDLELVFYIKIPEHMVKHATALIRLNHMEHWGVTLQELYHTAQENMAEVRTFLCPMERVLGGYDIPDMDSGLYVLSNLQKEFGAAVIVDPKVQKMCARRFGEDYYILPSSIHEVLLLPASAPVSRDELDALVCEVNGNYVSREDILSGHAYLYHALSGEIDF